MEEYAPGFKESIIDYEILTPPDLEREFSLTGGVRKLQINSERSHRIKFGHIVNNPTEGNTYEIILKKSLEKL